MHLTVHRYIFIYKQRCFPVVQMCRHFFSSISSIPVLQSALHLSNCQLGITDKLSHLIRSSSHRVTKSAAMEKDSNTVHLEKPPLDTYDKNWAHVTSAGREATAREHELSVAQAVRMYYKAVIWSIMISMVIIMEGYEIVLIGSLFGQPAFQKKYGKPAPDTPTGYQVPASWQAGLTAASNVGAFIGSLLNGWLSDKLGYRKVLMGLLSGYLRPSSCFSLRRPFRFCLQVRS